MGGGPKRDETISTKTSRRAVTLERVSQFGEEELEELDEKRRQQFLEKPVVIYGKHGTGGLRAVRCSSVS